MARPKKNKEIHQESPVIEGALETIIWYVIENTEHRAKPPLSDRDRFDKAIQAIFGKKDGRSKRDDVALLKKMHSLIQANKKLSVSAAAYIVANELPEEIIKARKEQYDRDSMCARLVGKYIKQYGRKSETFGQLSNPEDQQVYNKLILDWEREKESAKKAALKFIERYLFY